MNNQQVFDKVVAHLNAQGCRSLSATGDCVYLAPNGNMCAVGCLLGDAYKPEMENMHVETPVVRNVIEQLFPNVSINMLTCLQEAHDRSATYQQIVQQLDEIAADHHLTFNPDDITNWYKPMNKIDWSVDIA